MNTIKQGVMCVYNKENELIAIVHKDEKSRKNVFYSCIEMGTEEIEVLLNCDKVVLKS